MKNRKYVYVLLPLALLVWGLVIYEVTEAMEAPVSSGPATSAARSAPNSGSQEPEAFELLVNYRDPFLSKSSGSREVRQPVKNLQRPRPVQEASIPQPTAETIEWPAIVYKGYIENRQTKSSIAMLQVGGEDHLVAEGQKVAGIKLLQVLPDSVKVVFRKQQKYFKKG